MENPDFLQLNESKDFLRSCVHPYKDGPPQTEDHLVKQPESSREKVTLVSS